MSFDSALQSDFKERLSSYKEEMDFMDMIDMLNKLLTVDPASRISCTEATKHPWIKAHKQNKEGRKNALNLKTSRQLIL